jgi:hypothetical protein
MSVSDQQGVHQRREYVTEVSAFMLKIPKLNVDDMVSQATMLEHAKTSSIWIGICERKTE